MQLYINNVAEYTIETRSFEGRDHLVVPVVMMVEGVHNGSHGPLLHLAADLGAYPGSWDGIPVTITHPQRNGNNVSANEPGVLEEYKVGIVFNTHMDGNKLKADAWLDIQRLAAISPTALSYIQERRQLDVSVGVFNDEIDESGTHNNERYDAIARNFRPNHLALLPGEQGACSWDDGCGVRANSSNLKTEENEKMKDGQIKAKKDLIRNGFSVAINVNEDGFLDLVNKAQTKLDSMDNDQAVYFLEELYDNDLIYRVRDRTEGTTALYRQTYTVNTAGEFELTGDRSRVQKKVEYVQTNKMVRTVNKNKNKMATNDGKPCCKEKVDALIANKATRFTEEDREKLLTMDADMLDKFEPIVVEKKKEVKVEAPDMSDYVSKSSLKTADDFINLAPKDVQDSLRTGLQLNAERKEILVQSILDRAVKDSWTKEELEAYPVTMLEKFNKQFKNPVDYSINGSNPVPIIIDNVKVEPLLPGVYVEEAEKETEKETK